MHVPFVPFFLLVLAGLRPKSRFFQNFECIEDGCQCDIGIVPWLSMGFRA